MTTVVFSFLDAFSNQNNQITLTGVGLPPFTVTFTGPSIAVGATFTYTDGNHATFMGTYDGTNPNGDLIYHVGGSFQLLTNFPYTIGQTITINPVPFVCFLRGTLIRTPEGDVAVETLRAGDLVMTSSGESRPVKWIGHRDIDLRGRRDAHSFHPVRIAAGAFGADRPSKDLYVSAGHSICVDLCGEVLIPAGHLVNGSTIARVEMDDVSYWHVELESHDILVANNLSAESYLVMENRSFFVETHGTLDAPDDGLGRTHADFCRPVVLDGPVLAFAHQRLAERAEALGWTASLEADLRLLVDGEVRRPLEEGKTAVFLFPAGAQDVRLLSSTFVPAALGHGDPRELGLRLCGLSFWTSQAERSVRLDDERLKDGVYAVEAQNGHAFRWTKGELVLNPELWSGLSGAVALLVVHDSAAVRRWLAPAMSDTEVTSSKSAPRLRLVG